MLSGAKRVYVSSRAKSAHHQGPFFLIVLNLALALCLVLKLASRWSASQESPVVLPQPATPEAFRTSHLRDDVAPVAAVADVRWLPADFDRMHLQQMRLTMATAHQAATTATTTTTTTTTTTLPTTNDVLSANLELPPVAAAPISQAVAASVPRGSLGTAQPKSKLLPDLLASSSSSRSAIAALDPSSPHAFTTPSGCVIAKGDRPALRAVIMSGGTRVASLNRLLKSLADADSMGDRIDVDVWIDVPNRDRRSREHRERQALAKDIRLFKSNGTYGHGLVRAFVWSKPSGLRKQWLETWDRSTPCGLGEWTTEIGLMLEDDLELSPYFWRWLKGAHAAYGKDPRVAGFTLQRASLCAKKCPDLLGGPSRSSAAFFYPLVGSWGYSPTVAHWVRFRRWYYDFVKREEKPYVEGLTPTEWYKSFEGAGTASKRMWTMHHIKYVDTHQDKFTVYVKCPDNKTLSQNHLEPGINYATKRRSDHERLLDWDDALLNFPKFPLELDWAGQPIGGQGDAGGFV